MEFHRTWTSIAGAGALAYFGAKPQFEKIAELKAQYPGMLANVWEKMNPGIPSTPQGLSELESAIRVRWNETAQPDWYARLDQAMVDLGYASDIAVANESVVEKTIDSIETGEIIGWSLTALAGALMASGIAGFMFRSHRSIERGW